MDNNVVFYGKTNTQNKIWSNGTKEMCWFSQAITPIRILQKNSPL